MEERQTPHPQPVWLPSDVNSHQDREGESREASLHRSLPTHAVYFPNRGYVYLLSEKIGGVRHRKKDAAAKKELDGIRKADIIQLIETATTAETPGATAE